METVIINNQTQSSIRNDESTTSYPLYICNISDGGNRYTKRDNDLPYLNYGSVKLYSRNDNYSTTEQLWTTVDIKADGVTTHVKLKNATHHLIKTLKPILLCKKLTYTIDQTDRERIEI